MINWDYVRDASVKIGEIAVSPKGKEDVVLLRGKKSLHGNIFDSYFYLSDVPVINSRQILSLTEKGDPHTNFIRDIMEYSGRYVEKMYIEEDFHKGKPTKFSRSFLKFSTGEEMYPVSPPTSLVFGLASGAEIYVNKRVCDEKNKHLKDLRKIIESADFKSLEGLPSKWEKTEVSFDHNGYEELKNTGVSEMDFVRRENGKMKKVVRNILTINYSKNRNVFLFPMPLPYNRLVLEKYSDKLNNPLNRKTMKEALKKYIQKEDMEVLNYISDDIKTDSVFINGKVMKSSTSGVFVVEPVDSFVRLEMDRLRTFQTSYFFGLNSAFLNLDKIMLKPEIKLSYVS